MKRLTILVISLTLSVACGMPVTTLVNSPIIDPTASVNKETHVTTDASTEVNMVVIADKLNIRTSPNGEVVHYIYLLHGDIVTVYERQTVNGYEWCRTGKHWVGCEWLEEQ